MAEGVLTSRREYQEIAARIGARLGVLWRTGWTALVTLVALALVAWLHALHHHYTRITDFIEIGHQFGDPMGLSALANSRIGYDGQFYYFIARSVGLPPVAAIDAPALRCSRIVYPLLTRLLSLGNPMLMPWMMLAINFAAIAMTVALLAALLRARGLPQWLALVAGFFWGQPIGMLRDLTDPLMILCLVLALWSIARGRWLMVGAALGLGMLTREALLPFALCFAVPLVIERRWRTLVGYGALVVVPYAIWQLYVHAVFGTWGFGQTTEAASFVPLPFGGLLANFPSGLAEGLFLTTCVPVVAAMGYAVYALRRRPWHDPLLLAVAIGTIVYGIFFITLRPLQWLDIWGMPRLAAPIAVLLPLLVPKGAPRPRWYAVPWLMIGSVLLTFSM